MSSLNIGKITMEELKKYVFPYTGKIDPDVLIGPGIGEDAAVVKNGNNLIILKTDPISGALDKIGWESIHINANDVAAKGAIPRWFLATLILPQTYNAKHVEEIMKQIHEAALEVGVSIVGGHTEFIDGLTHPIIAGSMIGTIDDGKYFSSKNAQEGDYLILTKTAGIEATSILAEDLEQEISSILGIDFVNKSKKYTKKISILKEAKIARTVPGVTSLHDCTEGGVISAAYEVAEASNKGLLFLEYKIPVAEETSKLCILYDLNPIEIISSGSLLITVHKSYSNELLRELKKNGIMATIIGEIKNKTFGRKIKNQTGEVKDIKIPDKDPLWKLYNKIMKKIKKW